MASSELKEIPATTWLSNLFRTEGERERWKVRVGERLRGEQQKGQCGSHSGATYLLIAFVLSFVFLGLFSRVSEHLVTPSIIIDNVLTKTLFTKSFTAV